MQWPHLEQYLNGDFSYTSVGYRGENPFFKRLLAQMLEQKGLRLAPDADSYFTESSREATNKSFLVSQWPVSGVSGWCQAPLTQERFLNFLFYYRQLPVVGKGAVRAPRVEAFVGTGVEMQNTVAEFLDSLVTNFRLLVEAAYCDDQKTVGAIAHRMLSSVGYYPAESLIQYLQKLEAGQQVELDILLSEAFRLVSDLFSSLVNEYF